MSRRGCLLPLGVILGTDLLWKGSVGGGGGGHGRRDIIGFCVCLELGDFGGKILPPENESVCVSALLQHWPDARQTNDSIVDAKTDSPIVHVEESTPTPRGIRLVVDIDSTSMLPRCQCCYLQRANTFAVL